MVKIKNRNFDIAQNYDSLNFPEISFISKNVHFVEKMINKFAENV